MANLNKVFLMGNLTRDPELKQTQSQISMCNFGLAVNRTYSASDGSKKDETCFVECTAFGKTAETISQYLTKGKPVYLEGRLSFNQWTDDTGKKRNQLKVICEKFEFLPDGQKKPESTQETASDKDEYGVPPF